MRRLPGTLARIDSQEEVLEFVLEATFPISVWVGIVDTAQSAVTEPTDDTSKFQYLDDDDRNLDFICRKASQLPWAAEKPNNGNGGNQNCVIIKKGGLDDFRCDGIGPFLGWVGEYKSKYTRFQTLNRGNCCNPSQL